MRLLPSLLLLLPLLLACGEEDTAGDCAQGYQAAQAEQADAIARLAAEVATLQAQLDELQATGLATEAWVDEQGYAGGATVTALEATVAADQADLVRVDTRLSEVEGDYLAGDDIDAAAVEDLLAVVEVELAERRVVLHDVNVFIQSGSGATDDGAVHGDSLTGLGNLIIGYDEAGTGDKTGSHNLVVGPGHAYQGHGGIVAGQYNSIAGTGASVIGGTLNRADGLYGVVVAGKNNAVSGDGSVVVAGDLNAAEGHWSAILGGYTNTAAGFKSTISGGSDNETGDWWHCAILGGLYQQCTEDHDTVY